MNFSEAITIVIDAIEYLSKHEDVTGFKNKIEEIRSEFNKRVSFCHPNSYKSLEAEYWYYLDNTLGVYLPDKHYEEAFIKYYHYGNREKFVNTIDSSV